MLIAVLDKIRGNLEKYKFEIVAVDREEVQQKLESWSQERGSSIKNVSIEPKKCSSEVWRGVLYVETQNYFPSERGSSTKKVDTIPSNPEKRTFSGKADPQSKVDFSSWVLRYSTKVDILSKSR
jgi:hypothetical protein